MKKTILSLLLLSVFTLAKAQKSLPEIKVGTTMQASAFVNGSEFPLQLSIKSLAAPVSIGWSVDGYGEGSFEMSDKALESATNMSANGQPALGVTKLTDNETFGLISKAAYKSLSESKTFTYGGVKYSLKIPDTKPMKVDGKDADVTHVVSEDGKMELWILNNPALPLIFQSSGMATDIVINSVK
ncbi:hypothetical protein [Pedobacter mucosus]|uniref:hypothetical protein n=1 Tax=Pedobacter mucosus TaxID=2895286 RepID=UPI001EE45585|nr:hypothetical protein [Pedobacter mucosus]UKT65693.1 hypothetical protein LOK61_07850 [Pedobacter mucosus]